MKLLSFRLILLISIEFFWIFLEMFLISIEMLLIVIDFLWILGHPRGPKNDSKRVRDSGEKALGTRQEPPRGQKRHPEMVRYLPLSNFHGFWKDFSTIFFTRDCRCIYECFTINITDTCFSIYVNYLSLCTLHIKKKRF